MSELSGPILGRAEAESEEPEPGVDRADSSEVEQKIAPESDETRRNWENSN